jgi:protein regulator of cytokinesis 1
LNLNDVPAVDESDLTLKKLEEYQSELQELQKEKVIWLSCPIL